MTKHLSIMRFLSVVLLLDIVLIGLVFVSGPKAYAFLSEYLPGTFGPGMGPGMTGNHFLGALILQLDALLFLSGGFAVLANAARNTLMIGSSGIWQLLRGTAGLSREDIAATSFAVAEEQKSEIHTVQTGRSLVWIGAALLLLAFPAVCLTYAQANTGGAPLLQDTGGTIANTALSVEDVAVFTVDQLADAVLLDVPRVFQLHLGSLTPTHNYLWLRPFVLLFHILSKLVVLATLFAAWRSGHLRAYLLQMAGPDAVPALESLRDAPAAPHEESEEMLRQAAAAIHEPMPDHGRHVEHHLFEPAPVPHAAVEHTFYEQQPEPAIEDAVEYETHQDAPMPEPWVPDAPVPAAPSYFEAVEHPRQPELPLGDEPPAPEASIVEGQAEAEPVHHQPAAYASEPVFDAPAIEEPSAVEALGPIPVEPVHREPEPARHEPEEPPVPQSPDEQIAAEPQATAPEPMPQMQEHAEPAAAEEQAVAEPAPPAPDEVEHPLADTPLALHEPGTQDEPAETNSGATDEDGPKPPFPYRNTALHMPREFDA